MPLTNRIFSGLLRHRSERRIFRLFIPVLLIVVILSSFLDKKYINSNLIHKLPILTSENKEAPELLEFKMFYDSLEKKIKNKKIDRMVQIASFGGGLKANLWNLLILNKLSNTSNDPSFFMDRCLSLSGVSGGAVGLGNYLALDYYYREKPKQFEEKINEIGEANILSIDMAGLFFHDALMNRISPILCNKNESLFRNWKRQDRSFYAMLEYKNIVSDKTFLEGPLKSVWTEMYRKHKYIPALLLNSTAVNLKPGIAFSIDIQDPSIFPGYIQLTDNIDLCYYDAIGTANRFPILSPTAQVEKKGFFLDGGYFENSGLLTTSLFRDYIEKCSIEKNSLGEENCVKSIFDSIPILTISIINSKDDYIRKFISNNNIVLINKKYSTNTSSIIAGISDVNKLPTVLREKEKFYTKEKDQFTEIFLPHIITIEDIEAVVGGEIQLNTTLLAAIDSNNQKIDKALTDYGVSVRNIGIVAPLGRTLSKPAVDYQKAMIGYHVGCLKEIGEVVGFLEKRDTKKRNKSLCL